MFQMLILNFILNNYFLAMEYFGRSESDSDMFSCSICQLGVQGLQPYFDHTALTHNLYICHECQKTFTTKCSLLRHRPIHHGVQRYSCSQCSHKFHRRDKCKLHIKKKHDDEGNIIDMLGLYQCKNTVPSKEPKIVVSNDTVVMQNTSEIDTSIMDESKIDKVVLDLKKSESSKSSNGGFEDSNGSSCMDLWHNRDPYLQAVADTNTDTNSLPELTISQVASQIGDMENEQAAGLPDLGDSNSTTYLDLDNNKSMNNEFVLTTPEKTYTELTSFGTVPGNNKNSYKIIHRLCIFYIHLCIFCAIAFFLV